MCLTSSRCELHKAFSGQGQVKDGGYDQKVNETMSVVATKTTEVGQKTWGIMKGVMAMASQKVEEYTKDGMNWKGDDWQRQEGERNGYYKDFGQENKGWNTSEGNSQKNYNSVGSWDNWDGEEKKQQPREGTQDSESWAGWDDVKDDGYDDYSYRSSSKAVNQNGKSGSLWSEGGFL